MSSVCGDLFYLPLQSALSAADMRVISPRQNDAAFNTTPNGFWTQFIGDQSNSGLKCLADPSEFHSSFWPLVLYGGSGNGKTSIAMAFANRLANDQNIQPLFVRSADLVRRHRDAIQTDSMTDFRKRYLTAELLVIDDLHRLKNRLGVQKELAKLLDGLISRKKPVISTIDSLPSTTDWLIPQLASRLSSGLVLPVNRPGNAARGAIAVRLAERFDLQLNDSAIEFIVDHCDFSVPRLTQLFAQLKHSLKTSDEDGALDASHIKLALFGKRTHFDRDIQLITKMVASHFELPIDEVRGKSRKQTTVLARSICIYLCRDLLQLGFANIGRCFGGRDHSTIIHAHKNITKSVIDDTNLNRMVTELRRKLTDQFLLVVDP
jgi:chromosomal replication initiator protein